MQKRIKAEDELIKVWHHLEQMQKADVEQEKIFEQEKATCEQDLSTLLETLSTLKSKRTEQENEREKYTGEIPPDWLAKYTSMRERVDNPIVPVVQSSCGECYYAINYQDLSKLKKHSIVSCLNCHRLLYLNIEEEPEASTPSA